MPRLRMRSQSGIVWCFCLLPPLLRVGQVTPNNLNFMNVTGCFYSFRLAVVTD
jgi:hypothetical protein